MQSQRWGGRRGWLGAKDKVEIHGSKVRTLRAGYQVGRRSGGSGGEVDGGDEERRVSVAREGGKVELGVRASAEGLGLERIVHGVKELVVAAIREPARDEAVSVDPPASVPERLEVGLFNVLDNRDEQPPILP